MSFFFFFFNFCSFNCEISTTGHGGSRAAEYLKEHLFENLMKHPQFMTDTKLAISMLAFSILCDDSFFVSSNSLLKEIIIFSLAHYANHVVPTDLPSIPSHTSITNH